MLTATQEHYSELWDLSIPRDQKRKQGEEILYLKSKDGSGEKRYSFHDYDEIFKYPGLYEDLFYHTLDCDSPRVLTDLLRDFAKTKNINLSNWNFLDFGAGNGIMGKEIKSLDISHVCGIDILPEAKLAAARDNHGVYSDYWVGDLSTPSQVRDNEISRWQFDCLTCIAALGFDDIPPKAFLRALNFLKSPGWVVFNLKKDFFLEEDQTGFRETIEELVRLNIIELMCETTYQHRLSADGNALNYIGLIAKKTKPIPKSFIE